MSRHQGRTISDSIWLYPPQIIRAANGCDDTHRAIVSTAMAKNHTPTFSVCNDPFIGGSPFA